MPFYCTSNGCRCLGVSEDEHRASSRKIENSLTSCLSTERPLLVHWPISSVAGVYVISLLVVVVGVFALVVAIACCERNLDFFVVRPLFKFFRYVEGELKTFYNIRSAS